MIYPIAVTNGAYHCLHCRRDPVLGVLNTMPCLPQIDLQALSKETMPCAMESMVSKGAGVILPFPLSFVSAALF